MTADFQKEFNVEGSCDPESNYMVDISPKLDVITRLIDKGKYFTINRARQFGKTTILYAIYRQLSDRYIVISTSFEGMNESCFSTSQIFCDQFMNLVSLCLRVVGATTELQTWEHNKENVRFFPELSQQITSLCQVSTKPIVLLIDEVDKSSDNQMFLDFISMLRNKYLNRNILGLNSTFHSVVLAGVYDVNNLKLKIRPEAKHKYNSPWNIAAKFDVDMSFNPLEISTMLADYENDHKTGMDIMAISEEIYKFTSGYPFLVSAICKTIDERFGRDWTISGVQKAVHDISSDMNDLFADIRKNLENLPEFRDFIYSISIQNVQYQYSLMDPMVNLGNMFSIIKNVGNKVVIHNLIFEEIIYSYFTLRYIRLNHDKMTNFQANYIVNGKLNFEFLISRFRNIMLEEYRDSDEPFIEREGRLLFLCFLKPVINGSGFYYVEPETRNSSRMDLVVTFGNEEFIVELKIWRGQDYEDKGKSQLAKYLQSRGHDSGYLVTFDFSKNKKKTEPAWVECDGKRIFEVVI